MHNMQDSNLKITIDNESITQSINHSSNEFSFIGVEYIPAVKTVFEIYNKPIRHIVCAGALRLVKSIPLSCTNSKGALTAHVHTTCRFIHSFTTKIYMAPFQITTQKRLRPLHG